jgi:alanyl-tRNA synthetase
MFKEYIKEYNGKGGGNNNRAQGSFEYTEDLEAFYEMLCEKVKSYINLY